MVSNIMKAEVSESKAFKSAIRNIITNSNRTHVSKNTERDYLDALTQYLRFLNSERGLTRHITADDLVVQAKANIDQTKERIRLFFLWLQGEPLSNFEPREKKMLPTSALIRSYGQVKGFYTNNGVVFGKWKTPSLENMEKKAIENDTTVPFFKIDDKKRIIFLDRGMIKQFLSNLKFRDKTVFLAMLSSSHDSGDLFKLTVGKIRQQMTRQRFFWEGVRGKTEIRFKTFFSAEATDFIRRYIEQERAKAKDSEPLFISKGEKMEPNDISSVFRGSAKKMGIKWENGEQSPLRPKRLRHIFRTASRYALVDEGYIHVFMGHKSSISRQYLEKDVSLLELEYSKAEPFLTVYGLGEEEGVEELRKELNQWKSNYIDQKIKVENLEKKLTDVSVDLKRVEDLTRELAEKWMRQQEEEERESQKDLERFRQDFTKRLREESSPQKSKIDEASEKTSAISISPKPTPSPQKEGEEEDRDAGLFIGTRRVH